MSLITLHFRAFENVSSYLELLSLHSPQNVWLVLVIWKPNLNKNLFNIFKCLVVIAWVFSWYNF